jgi:hypothetical protein
MASPDATDPNDAEASAVPNARPPIVRYLTEAGQITDDPGSARRQWVPRLCLSVVLDGAVTSFDCKVTEIIEKGTHLVVFAEVQGIRHGHDDEHGLIYYGRDYHPVGKRRG